MRRIEVHDLCMNNKALVITVPDYEWGSGRFNGYVKWLVSYATTVACIDTDGKFKMLVEPSGVSNTTARHISRFVEEYAPSGTDWKKCKVFKLEI